MCVCVSGKLRSNNDVSAALPPRATPPHLPPRASPRPLRLLLSPRSASTSRARRAHRRPPRTAVATVDLMPHRRSAVPRRRSAFFIEVSLHSILQGRAGSWPGRRQGLLRLGLVADFVAALAGTKVGYRPGVVVGGKDLEHDCGVHRGIGYFIEPLVLLGLFARSTLSIRLKAEGCFLILFLLEIN